MINVAFVVVILIWVLVARQVKYWMVMAALGWKIETPLLFLQKDYLYLAMMYSLLALSIIAAIFQTLVPTWLAVVLVLGGNSVLKHLARKRALKAYRKIVRDLIDYRKENGELTEDLEQELLVSDKELFARARERVRLGLV